MWVADSLLSAANHMAAQTLTDTMLGCLGASIQVHGYLQSQPIEGWLEEMSFGPLHLTSLALLHLLAFLLAMLTLLHLITTMSTLVTKCLDLIHAAMLHR